MSTYNTNTNASMPGDKPFPTKPQRPSLKANSQQQFKSGNPEPGAPGKNGVILHVAGCGGNHLGKC